MKSYVIIEGSIKTQEGFKGPGETIQLSETDARAMDPFGTALMPKEKHEAQQRAKKAAEAELQRAEESESAAKTSGKGSK